MKDKKLVLYLLWAFALAWPLQAAASSFARQGNQTAFQLIMMCSMFAPLVAAMLAGIPLKDMGWKPILRGKWGWFFAAWFVPALLTVLGAAVYFLCFPGRLDLSGAYTVEQLRNTVGEEGLAEALAQLEETGLSLRLLTLVSAVQAVTYAPILNCLVAVGEEAGWRGAMLPRLKERFGRRRGWLLGGLIWGAWHWPVMILAGYEYGFSYWGAPLLGLLVFCLFTTALGLLLDLCYEKTRCIWVPALGHGAVNAAAGIPLLFLNPAYSDRLIFGPSMQGLIAGIPLFLLALFVLLRAKDEGPRPAEEAES